MANPQKENGSTPIANEIMDAFLSRNFSKRQVRILNIVWRFSYGFNKKEAYIDQMKDFEMYGVPSIKVAKTLRELEAMSVLCIDWSTGVIQFNKDYSQWDVPLNSGYNETRHRYLIRLNIRPSERNHRGWNNARRGGGRPKMNKGQVSETETNRIPKQKPTGFQSGNLQGMQTETYDGDKPNDSVTNRASKSSRFLVGNTSSSIPNDNIIPSKEVATVEEEEKDYKFIRTAKKIGELWPPFIPVPGSTQESYIEDMTQFSDAAIDEAIDAARRKGVQRGNFRWILNRLRFPERYNVVLSSNNAVDTIDTIKRLQKELRERRQWYDDLVAKGDKENAKNVMTQIKSREDAIAKLEGSA